MWHLPKFEIAISFILYVGTLIYAIYEAYRYGNSELDNYQQMNSLFLPKNLTSLLFHRSFIE